MARTLGFPEVEHEQLANPPLKAMLGQVQFPPILRIADPASLAPFQEALAGTFPEFAPEQQVSITVGPEGASTGRSQSFSFSTPDNAWSVVLAPTALTLEASAAQYTSYAAFRERFQEVWAVALEQLKPQRRHQIGLRYIDHLEQEQSPDQWTDWIRPEIVGLIAQPEIAEHVRQSLTDIRLELDHGILAFKHGIVQAGPEARWGYLLDFDYFQQEQSDEIGSEALIERFDCFHEEIYAFFRWCLAEKAVKEFSDGG